MVKKPDSDEDLEFLPAGEMCRKYGLYAENRPVFKLNPINPVRLRA